MLKIQTFTEIDEFYSKVIGAIDLTTLDPDYLLLCQSRPIFDYIHYKSAQDLGIIFQTEAKMVEGGLKLIFENLRIDGEPLLDIDKIVYADSLALLIWQYIHEKKPIGNARLEFEKSQALATTLHQFTLNHPLPKNLNEEDKEKEEIIREVLHTKGFETLGMFTARLLEQLKNCSKVELPIKRIVSAGSSFLPKIPIAFLEALSKFIDIEHFIYNPLSKIEKDSLKNWGNFGKDNFKTLTKQDLEGNAPELKNKQIEIIGAPNRWREVRFVREKILSILNKSPDTPLNKIAIICPDPAAYAPYLEAIFADERKPFDLSLHIVDEDLVPLEDLDTYLRILKLPARSMRRSDFIDLILSNPVQKALKLSEDDAFMIRDWIIQHNVFEHISYQEREKEGFIHTPTGTIADLLKRLGDSILNQEIGSTQLPIVKSFISFIARLSRFLEEAKKDRSIPDWATYVRELYTNTSSSCLVEWRENDREQEEQFNFLSNAISNTVRLTQDIKEFSQSLSFEFFVILLENQLAQTRVSKGKALLNGVTISRFSPARLIPFQHVFLIGLNDGSFPSSPHEKKSSMIQGQAAKESYAQDLYAITEIMSVAKHSVYISYISRNQKTMDWRSPSSVVWALLLAGVFTKNTELSLNDGENLEEIKFELSLPESKNTHIEYISPRFLEDKKTLSTNTIEKRMPTSIDIIQLFKLFESGYRAYYKIFYGYSDFNDTDKEVVDNPSYEFTNSIKTKYINQSAMTYFDNTQESKEDILNEFIEDKNILDNFSLLAQKELLTKNLKAIWEKFEKSNMNSYSRTDIFKIPRSQAISLHPNFPKITADIEAFMDNENIFVFSDQNLDSPQIAILAYIAYIKTGITYDIHFLEKYNKSNIKSYTITINENFKTCIFEVLNRISEEPLPILKSSGEKSKDEFISDILDNLSSEDKYGFSLKSDSFFRLDSENLILTEKIDRSYDFYKSLNALCECVEKKDKKAKT